MATTNECNCNTGAAEATPVYYKDDLDFYLKLLDGEGNDIGLPDYDWSARVWTSSKMNYVTVSSVGGVKANWRDEGDGRIHVVVDNPGLMPGDVHIDFEALLPNETFADGTRKLVKPFTAPIRLTRDCAPCPSAMEIELMLPYVRGKALTFDDLTDAEKDAFAQQAADLVTIEDLGVASDEEVDEAMGELLDTPPATMKEKAFHLDRRIRRGIMPAKARPGIVYYDYGYIKISPYRGYGVYQLEWDLTAFQTVLDSVKNIYVLPIFKSDDSAVAPEYLVSVENVGDCLKSDYYEYDSMTHVLKLNLPVEKIGIKSFAVRYRDTPAANNLSYGFFHRDNDEVMWIGKNGLLVLPYEKSSVILGLEEYKPRPFNLRELQIIAEYLCGCHSYNDIKYLPGIGKFIFWKKKDSGRSHIELLPIKYKWCKQMTRLSKKTKMGDGTPNFKMGVVKIVRTSSSGYRSEPVIIWVFKDINTGKVHFSILN